MKKVEIGRLEDGKPFYIDVKRIVEGKQVVQSSSGGGKSMTLRTMLEATHGILPHIILDKDGEYSTLRERHDYILAGKNGDIPTSCHTAAMLARKVMELDLSIIVDLYDLPHDDKHKFVRIFMEAAFNAPKTQWHDRLFVVDEAHRFCPENGEGVSEAKDIIIECCDDGRKRGMGMVLATQRIAKLDKSALAECENKLIGRTNFDDDRRRAGKELGFSSKEDLLSLRDLKRGYFYAQGAALSDEVVKVIINKAKTTHPSSGHRIIKKAPAPTSKVKSALAKLIDLPKEAEKEAQDLMGLQSKVRQLEMALRQAQATVAVPAIVERLSDKEIANVKKMAKGEAYKWALDAVKGCMRVYEGKQQQSLKEFAASLAKELQAMEIKVAPPKFAYSPVPAGTIYKSLTTLADRLASKNTLSTGGIDTQQQRIIDTIAMLVKRGFEPNREMVARWMGIHPTGGRYGSNLAVLREMGFVEDRGTKLTDTGQNAARPMEIGFQEFRKVLDGSRQAIADVLVNDQGKVFSRETLAEALGLHPTGGRYGSNLALLRAMGAIPDRGAIQLVSQVFK